MNGVKKKLIRKEQGFNKLLLQVRSFLTATYYFQNLLVVMEWMHFTLVYLQVNNLNRQ